MGVKSMKKSNVAQKYKKIPVFYIQIAFCVV